MHYCNVSSHKIHIYILLLSFYDISNDNEDNRSLNFILFYNTDIDLS